MKATFAIPQETQVRAVKQFVVPDDPANPDPDLDFPGPYELEMSVEFMLVPGEEYEVLHVVSEPDNKVTIWLNETFYIPDYPKEKVTLI